MPCNLQSATAGFNPLIEVHLCGAGSCFEALMAGPRAIPAREPCQVLTEAALSEFGCVPRVVLVGALCVNTARKAVIDIGCTVFLQIMPRGLKRRL